MAMAMAVPSRLWLGGVVSARRDLSLITAVVQMVRRAAKRMAFLVCVDGLASYVTAFVRVFRDPVRTGQAGRPRLVAIPGLLLGQVIKHHSGRRLVGVTRRAVLGTAAAIAAVLAATGTGTGSTRHTSSGSTRPSARRWPLAGGRAIVRGEGALTGWMDLVGCAYNFCWDHDSLRIAAPPGERLKWRDHTPAMAAGLTDHHGRWRAVECPIPCRPGSLRGAGASAEANSGPPAGPDMITVPCGATGPPRVVRELKFQKAISIHTLRHYAESA